MHPDSASREGGTAASLDGERGPNEDPAPNTCSLAIIAWEGGAGGEPALGTEVLGGCAGPLCCLLSARQKIGCKGELAHTCVQLKPEELMLEVTRTLLLSNIGLK